MTLANIVDIATKPRWWMRHARHQAPHLPQHRRPRAGREGHARARGLDRRAVRPDAQLGRREAHQGPLGRQADPQGHSGSRGRRAGRAQRRRRADRLQSRRPAARRRHLLHRRSSRHRRRRRQPHRGAHGRRHPLRPGRAQGAGARRQGRVSSAAPTSTASAPWARPAWPRRSSASGRSSTSPWPCAACTDVRQAGAHNLVRHE